MTNRARIKIISSLIATLWLSGCSGILLHHAMDPQSSLLTPEQIDAYDKVGSDVYTCFQVGGPPPIGQVVLLTWPKTKPPPQIVFGANCQILQAR